MSDTKEKILTTALYLFARDGYEAVSVRTIAESLGITKGALYKHYKNKRDIFDSIVARMSQTDAEKASEYEMPEDTIEHGEEAYRNTSLEQIRSYSKAQFRYWTEDAFASNFRKMLTLEQYRNPEMAKLYQQYLAGGPLMYMADLFTTYIESAQDAMQAALAFYSPYALLYNIYDSTEDKVNVYRMMDAHIDRFIDYLNDKTVSSHSKQIP